MPCICQHQLTLKNSFLSVICFATVIVVTLLSNDFINDVFLTNIDQPVENLTISKLLDPKKTDALLQTSTVIPQRPRENFICNNETKNYFPVSLTTSFNDSFDIYRKAHLQKYCSIVPIPRHKWSKPQAYYENEIAFVIFTGTSFYHTRATATRDTWLSRITNYYFLGATAYPYLPVTVVPDAGDDKLSNMKKLFYGLETIYQHQMKLLENQRQKWFYIAGCDTFILPHHLLKRLEGLDYRKPILLGGHSGRHVCLEEGKRNVTVDFPSGGAGFFFSMKLLEMMQPHLKKYVEKDWPRKNDASDVAFACLAFNLGVKLTKRAGFWAHPPNFTLTENKRWRFHAEPEPNDFHYIKPDEMYALDEFYVNQHMDRLISDQNLDEFIRFTRRFVSSHYELLRKKRRECTLPKTQNKTH